MALSLKQKIVEYPQTLFAMIGSSGRSVKFVVAYTYPDGSLPRSRTDAEVFMRTLTDMRSRRMSLAFLILSS